MTEPQPPSGAGDAPAPAPDGFHERLSVDATGTLSWRDLDGGFLTVAFDVRWDAEWRRHARSVVVAGHRIRLDDARLVEQAIRWIREALALSEQHEHHATAHAPPPWQP